MTVHTNKRAHPIGVPNIVVFINKSDIVDDEELLDLVEIAILHLNFRVLIFLSRQEHKFELVLISFWSVVNLKNLLR